MKVKPLSTAVEIMKSQQVTSRDSFPVDICVLYTQMRMLKIPHNRILVTVMLTHP